MCVVDTSLPEALEEQRSDTSPFRVLVLCALIGSWASIVPPVQAAGLEEPTTPETYEALIQRAGDYSRAEEPDHSAAAGAYLDAYAAMPPEVKMTDLGHFVVAEAGRIHYQVLWPETHDSEPLRACEAVMREHVALVDEARAAGNLGDQRGDDELRLRRTLEAVEAELAALQAEANAAAKPQAPPPKPVPPTPLPAQPEDSSRDRARKETLAKAVVSTGTLFILGGVALTIDGLLFPSMIEKKKARQRAVEESEGDLAPGDPDPPAFVEHEKQMRRRGYAVLGSGLGVLAGGVAMVLVGNLVIAPPRDDAKSSTAKHRLRPGVGVGRNGVSVAATLRF